MRSRFSRSLKVRWAASTLLVLTLIVGTVPQAFANLGGSTFEGNDGNLVVNSPGNTDWENAPNRVVGLDQPSGSSDNSFGQGTKEDNAAVTVVTGSIPPNKNDLTRFYIASEFAGGSNYLYLAWERAVNIGSANLDFEINQAKTTGFTGTTTGPVTLNRTAGDLLVTYDFGGSGTPALGLATWVTSGATSQCIASNSLPCWGNRVSLTGANSEGAVNPGTVTDPVPPNGPRTLTTGLFGEAAINLTAAGVFPAGTCEAFGSVFLKSRASASFGAEVKDFIAPQAVNISNCGSIAIHKVTVNGDGTFGYTTTGGLTPSTFNLSNGATQSYTAVVAGPYSVTESTLPANWLQTNLTCTVTGSGTSATPNNATISITMAAGGAVDCTYTNTQQLGAIKVTKQSTKGNAPLGGASFSLSGNGVSTTFPSTAADGTACLDNLAFGTYSVTETGAPGGYRIDNPGAVSVTIDHIATCTSGTPNAPPAFTDTPLSTLAVTFDSLAAGNPTSATIQCTGPNVNDSGTLADETARFVLNLNNPSTNTLAPGTYTCTVVIDP